MPEVHVEICSHCHPFFTGKQKLVDTAGRVERFRQRYSKKPKASAAAETPETPAASKTPEASETPEVTEASEATETSEE